MTELLEIWNFSLMASITKIGEGVYGEVFRAALPGEDTTVYKVLSLTCPTANCHFRICVLFLDNPNRGKLQC